MYIVDAFTDRPLAGNPAAVCLLLQPAENDWCAGRPSHRSGPLLSWTVLGG
ncbi:PhzF family phenazine biosynthesis protein [Geobacillus vulcani]|uniref:PhzF family phenazine biosynthesis protein n=1 Tax=Geobacillus vulcani TaxID=135517 RepID=UPI00138DEBCF|nr:PhzF family phenazine biosynthesis protein [Geobacillus vulcani]